MRERFRSGSVGSGLAIPLLAVSVLLRFLAFCGSIAMRRALGCLDLFVGGSASPSFGREAARYRHKNFAPALLPWKYFVTHYTTAILWVRLLRLLAAHGRARD